MRAGVVQIIVGVGLSAVCLGGALVLAAGQTVTIGEILSNPAGFHRKLVCMQRMVHAIGTRSAETSRRNRSAGRTLI